MTRQGTAAAYQRRGRLICRDGSGSARLRSPERCFARRYRSSIYRALSDLSGEGRVLPHHGRRGAPADRIATSACSRSRPRSAGWSASSPISACNCTSRELVARDPHDAGAILRTWLAVRLWTAGAAIVMMGAASCSWPAASGSATCRSCCSRSLYVGNALDRVPPLLLPRPLAKRRRVDADHRAARRDAWLRARRARLASRAAAARAGDAAARPRSRSRSASSTHGG